MMSSRLFELIRIWGLLIWFGEYIVAIDWTYKAGGFCNATSPCGPSDWGAIYSNCAATNLNQSPIDINQADIEIDDEFQGPIPATSSGCNSWVQSVDSNNLFNVDFVNGGCYSLSVLFNGLSYTLEGMVFHSVSEHTVAGGYREVEVQLVHRSASTDLKSLVISVFLQSSTHSPNNVFLDQVWNAAGYSVADVSISSNPTALNPYSTLLPAVSDQLYYSGSATTPNCTSNVDWFIHEQIVPISIADLNFIRLAASKSNTRLDSVEGNNRPIQKLNNRKIYRIRGDVLPTAAPSAAPTAAPSLVVQSQASTNIGPNKLTQKALIVGSVALGMTGILYIIVFAVVLLLMIHAAKERRSRAASSSRPVVEVPTRIQSVANHPSSRLWPYPTKGNAQDPNGTILSDYEDYDDDSSGQTIELTTPVKSIPFEV